jgi:DNA-binding FadR family transcriptional regulator
MDRVNRAAQPQSVAPSGAIALAASSGAFGFISTQTLATQLSRRLMLSILRGDLEAGSPLPSEKELARQFDVSRPVVREAVKEVEMLGLVQRRQGRLTRIAPSEEWRHLSPELLTARTEAGAVEDLLLELLELRRMVELEAAALAARRATDDDLQSMQGYLGMMDAELDDFATFAQHDIAFHDAILTSTGNNLLGPLYKQLRPLIEFGRRISAQVRKGGRAESQRGHRAIYEAILAQDPVRAREAMNDHLSWTGTLELAERERRLDRPRRTSPPRKLAQGGSRR